MDICDCRVAFTSMVERCWKDVEGYWKDFGRMVMGIKLMINEGQHCYQDGWKVKG